jgi:hypothetical protein
LFLSGYYTLKTSFFISSISLCLAIELRGR